ncbi:MAG: DUF6900 domain-containing protein, partial [Thalassovita sp.]
TSLEPLQSQNSDPLDFGGIAVWQLEAALSDAYKLGCKKAETNSLGVSSSDVSKFSSRS